MYVCLHSNSNNTPNIRVICNIFLFNTRFQILALASFAMALLPVGYQSSIPFAREGITSTIGFQVDHACTMFRVWLT
jgi:hypothetical protein